MKFSYGAFTFDGDPADLLLILEASDEVRKFLGASKRFKLADGASYTLESFQTWDDEDDDNQT